MFRPLLVRPSSGWIPWSEEMYNSATQPLKSGGTRSRLQKWGVCKNYWYKYEGWNFNSGNYLFTTDTK